MKKVIPKVKFRIAELKEIIGLINYFLNPKKKGWDWSNKILKKYPKLKEKLENIKNIEKRKKITHKFFADTQRKEKKELEKSMKEFQKEWNKINNKVMETLSKVVEIKWPKDIKIIAAKVSLNPICPRNIKKKTFDVYYKANTHRMKEIAIHEILHFIYFEKWKEIFPKTKEKYFDAPYMIWQLSEMVPPIILSDKKIQKVFKHKPLAYKEYEAMKIKNKSLLSYFQEFYNKKKNFKDFLKKSYSFVKKHEKTINKPTLEVKRSKKPKKS